MGESIIHAQIRCGPSRLTLYDQIYIHIFNFNFGCFFGGLVAKNFRLIPKKACQELKRIFSPCYIAE